MTSLDSYITLGHSGLRISPLGLGTMTFGEDHGWGTSVETSEAILTEYLEHGGNLIDTANAYTDGHSEKIIGDYFAARPGRRDRVVLSTKFLSNLFPGDPNGGGGGRKAIIDQLNESLRRLQTHYIDLYWLHGWDRNAPIEETMSTLNDLVTSGKVRYIALSDVPAWVAAQAQTIAAFRGWTPITALQLEYNLLERTSEGELLPMAQTLGIGVVPWSPLRGGKLTGKYTRDAGNVEGSRAAAFGQPAEQDWPVIDTVTQVAKNLDVTPAQVALAWVRGRPGISSTLIGARTIDQLRTNLASLDVTLTPQQHTTLDEVSTPTLDFPASIIGTSATVAFGGMTIDGTPYPAIGITGKY
ncbi:aldo/keto reductase [Streptomyces sp. NPDC056844]|uniref:aldo/keto reductase n=1 Tax=unclassified Streptomyces TaxID=2593676 RepID=UPI003684A17E